MSNSKILKRLFKDYTQKYLKNILISVFFTILLAGSTSSIAYLLDPAINKLFIEQDQSLMFIIPEKFNLIALIFSVLCILGTIERIFYAYIILDSD